MVHKSALRTKPFKRVDPRYLTPEWRRFRLTILERDGYRCVICRADVSAKGAARVDHPTPISQGGAMFDPRCRTLCTTCDAQAHRERARGGSGLRDERFVIRGTDAEGWPIGRVS